MDPDIHPFLTPEKQSKCCTSKHLLYILAVLNLTLIGLLIAAVVYSTESTDRKVTVLPSELDHLAQQYVDALPDNYIPSSYAVADSYYIPATNQASRGTCWCFSTLMLLESQYKAQGIRQGFLNDDEYVLFSKQAWFTELHTLCTDTPMKVCNYGGLINRQSAADNQVEALPYFIKDYPSLKKSLLPESVCEYFETEDPDTSFKCDGLEKALEPGQNPIEFEIKSFTTAYDTRGIKELLLAKERPLGFSTPLDNLIYSIPCEGSSFEADPQCTDKLHKCPFTQKEDEYCYQHEIMGTTRDGVFVTLDAVERVQNAGGHAMNLVGYNDNWYYQNRMATPESVTDMHGCFILHNSWRADGHSIDFLMGTRTQENENTVCPNHRTPTNWIPANLQETIEAGGDLSQVSKSMKRIRGNGLTEHADELLCIDTSGLICNPDYRYALGRTDNTTDAVNAYPMANGLYDIEMLEINEGVVESRRIQLPFWTLGDYFKPADIVANDPDDCGFYAMPYLAVENAKRVNWDLFDNMKASDIEVEFTSGSYVRSPESARFNTTLLKESTRTVKKPVFDGPVPFDRVYGGL